MALNFYSGIDFLVLRLNTDGSLDTTFADNGYAIIDFEGDEDWAHSLLVQDDDKIIVSGEVEIGSKSHIGVVRLNIDGAVDTSFIEDGKALSVTYSNSDIDQSSSILQSDGKIVFAAHKGPMTNYDVFSFRVNANGSIDSSYGEAGEVITDFNNRSDYFPDLTIQSDNKVVLTARSSVEYSDDRIALARYNYDGSLDTTFGSAGKVITDFIGTDDISHSIIMGDENSILVAGEVFDSITFDTDFSIYKYTNSGELYTSFGEGGRARSHIDYYDAGSDIIFQSDGKILMCGSFKYDLYSDFAIQRYNREGFLDTTFAVNGVETTDFYGYMDGAGSMILQPDNKIVVSGLIDDDTLRAIGTARYINHFDTGLEYSYNKQNDYIICPNPVNDIFSISYMLAKDKPYQLKIYDLLGVQKLEIKNYNLNQTVNIGNLSNGIYLVQLDNTLFFKIVKL
jgi:uncharacterized delta-60 repeat protein